MIQNRLLLVTTLICLWLLSSCNNGTGSSSSKMKLSPEAKASAEKTLVALREFDIVCGQNKPLKECKERLVKVRAETEQALTKMPEGEFKTEISLALEAYVTRMRVIDEIDETTRHLNLIGIMLGQKPTANDPPEFSVNKVKKEEADFIELLKKKYATKYRDGLGYAVNANNNQTPNESYTSFDGTEVLASTLKAGREHIERASILLQQ